MSEHQPRIPENERQAASSSIHAEHPVHSALAQSRLRARNPLYLPRWSLAVMFMTVLLLAALIVALVVALRGGKVAPVSEPLIQVVTANKTDERESDKTPEANITATGSEIIIAAETPVNLTIAGPILPTVDITNTPLPLTVGAMVQVVGVGGQELNIRNQPGLTESKILFRAPEGALFDVFSGPQEADGFTWWQVRDRQFQVEGWAVANYLQVMK